MLLRAHLSQVAAWIEEASRQDSLPGKITSLLVFSSLLDRLGSRSRLLRNVAASPAMTLLGLLIVYLVFVVAWLPLWLLSFLLSTPGSVSLFVVLVVLAVRAVARTIMFPGSTKNLQRQYAADYLRRLSAQLEGTSTLTTNFTASLMLVSSGRNAPVLDKLNAITHAVEALSEVAGWLQRAVKEVLESSEATEVELQPAVVLRQAIDKNVSAMEDIKAAAADVLTRGPASNYSHGQPQSSVLLLMCKRLLQASDSLKAASLTLAPRPDGNNGASLCKKIADLVSCHQGPAGCEKLSFPMMRQQICTQMGGEHMVVSGPECNSIDCVYIPRRQSQQQQQQQQQQQKKQPCETSRVGTVLFCGGNASLYETISQAPRDASWVGHYRRLGFDVCFFNYRGYNRSSGVPSPDRIRQDGLAVAKYLRERRRVTTLLVHGESIGGLVASHIAKSVTVEMLVCDRTFASLDAVAARLMGQWAFVGLRYLGLYRSDVVSDYLHAACPKMLLQDPNDEIILNAASLKNGVATSLLLGERLWNTRHLPLRYTLADLTNLPVPQMLVPAARPEASSSPPPALPPSSSPPSSSSSFLPPPSSSPPPSPWALTEAHLAHFTACVKNIARRASSLRRLRHLSNGTQPLHRHKATSPLRSAPKPRLRSVSANPQGDDRDGPGLGRLSSASKDDEMLMTSASRRASSSATGYSSLTTAGIASGTAASAASSSSAAAPAAPAASAAAPASASGASATTAATAPAPQMTSSLGSSKQVGNLTPVSSHLYTPALSLLTPESSPVHSSRGVPGARKGDDTWTDCSFDENIEWSTIDEEEEGEGGEGEEEDGLPCSPIHLGKDEANRGAAPSSDWLNSFCSQSIDASSPSSSSSSSASAPGAQGPHGGVGASQSASLAPIEKLWVALARTSGGGGQLLGQALAEDLDGVRCWVCSLVVWGPGAGMQLAAPVPPPLPAGAGAGAASAEARACTDNWSDAFLPAGTRDIHHAAAEVAALCHAYPSLDSDEAARFVREALMALRRSCCEETGASGGAATVRAFPSIDSFPEPTFYIEPSSEDEAHHLHHHHHPSGNGPKPSFAQVRGHLLPVHCGHNGFPNSEVIKVFTHHLRSAGLNVDMTDNV